MPTRSPTTLLAALLAATTVYAQPAPDFITVLGGSGDDRVFDLALDAQGNTYVTGETSSIDFPVVGGVQATRRGTFDAFVVKLDPAGQVVYSTYLGGDGFDSGRGIAVDAQGNAWITGYTESANFPLQDPLDASRGGFSDAFIARLSAAGDLLQFSTYFGGGNADNGEAIAVDADGRIYVAGRTTGGLSVVNAAQPVFGGVDDGFVLRLNSAATAYEYVTYLGGNFTDIPAAIAVDPAGRACIVGSSQSTVFPLVNPSQPAPGGATDSFYTVIASDGASFTLSSWLGGTSIDEARGVSCDTTRIAIVGDTRSTDFPTGSTGGPPVQAVNGGERDGFLVEATIASGVVQRSTYAGGVRDDRLVGVGPNASGGFQAFGDTSSSSLAAAAGAPVAAATAGVFASGDGGATWQAAGLAGLAVNELLVVPGVPERRVAATDAGLYVSTDAGVTWVPQVDDYVERAVHDVTFDPANPCVWIAAIESAPADGATPVGAVRSADCGATWVPWSFPARRFHSVEFLVDSTRIVASADRVSTTGDGSLEDTCQLNADGSLNRCYNQGSSRNVVHVDRTEACRFLIGDAFGGVTSYRGVAPNGCNHPLQQTLTTATAGSPVTALLAIPSPTAGPTLLYAGAGDGRIVSRDGAGAWTPVTTLQCPVSALAWVAGSSGAGSRQATGSGSVFASGCPTVSGPGIVEFAPDAPIVTQLTDDTGAASFGGIRGINLDLLANTNLTSRLSSFGADAALEALLLVDDPGTADREAAAVAVRTTNIRIGANQRGEGGYRGQATLVGTLAGRNIVVVGKGPPRDLLLRDGFESLDN
jgi:hypothetical protein